MVPLRTDMYVPVMMEIAIAVATTARTHGYDVLLLTGEEGPGAVRRVTGSGLADAMILMDVELDDERLPLLRADRPARRADRAARRHQRTDLRRPRLRGDGRAVRRAPGRCSATGTSLSSARPPAVYERHTGFAERTLDGLRSPGRELGMRVLHRPCEGGYDAMAVHAGPDPRRAPGHHRLRRAERGGRRAPARACCASRAVPCPRTCRWSRSARTRSPCRPRCG